MEYKTGDILGEDVEALVNTVNSVGVMGRGMALQFKWTFPDNFRTYAACCKRKEMMAGPSRRLRAERRAVGSARQPFAQRPGNDRGARGASRAGGPLSSRSARPVRDATGCPQAALFHAGRGRTLEAEIRQRSVRAGCRKPAARSERDGGTPDFRLRRRRRRAR